jgi:XapX domain-containing protein
VILKATIGIVLALLIGVGCRYFEIPLPGPPAILGAILAVAMATGYTLTDRALRAAAPAATPAVAPATAESAQKSSAL